MTQDDRVPWLQWLAIAVLLLAGLVGLGLSLCGGVFLLASLGGSSGIGDVTGLATVCLAVGLVVLFVSLRQVRAISREPIDGVQGRLPREVKRVAWLAVADFLLTGLWFLLPLIVSLLRRRRWARPVIAAIIVFKWFAAFGLMYAPYGGWRSVLAFGAPIVVVILDIAVLVALFSGPVSAWFKEAGDVDG